MKTFEERHTAWLDGLLSGDSLTAFEQELIERGEAPTDRVDFAKFQAFLRTHAAAPMMDGADFFNHQLLEKITAPSGAVRPVRFWALPRLAWFGGLSLTASVALFLAIIPKKSETHSQSAYIAQVISARSADPQISATAFQTRSDQPDNMTVVWLDGLDYVPADAQ